MQPAHTIFVFFDGLAPKEFRRRLAWDYLVKAWSGSISWRQLDDRTVSLELNGIDGLTHIFVTRREINGRIYIAARRKDGPILQTGAWWIDAESGLCCCARRIYDKKLVETLDERLPDFCFNTFVRHAA
jgi:hypothetical protein